MLKIQHFTVEHRIEPLGLDEERPAFSYRLESDRRNVVQKKMRLVVRQGENTVWDTGMTESGETLYHIYAGAPLAPCTRYDVKVHAEDNHGDTASAETCFETGLMPRISPVKAQFVTHGFEEENLCPVLCKRFSCGKKVRGARLYASALGMYDLTLNGERVGDLYFTPYWTSYRYALEYQTYDVTALLREHNELEMTLADGWYKGELTWLRKKNLYGDRLAGWLELHVCYEDGTTEKIVTDETWQSRQSSIISSLYDGECQNFCAEKGETRPARVYAHDTGILVSQLNEPVRRREILKVKEILKSPQGETILDFGQNLTGRVEFRARGKKGQKVVLRFAEVLDRYGNLYTDNLRTAKATDTFILSGKEQTYAPRFTFHGFRYCEVQGADGLSLEDFRAVAMYSDMARSGRLETSDEDMNKLYENQFWSNRGNFLDLPTDCPQRDERLGWTADAMIYCRTACTNFNAYLFFRKWLKDVAHEQSTEYGVPHIVPNPLEQTDSAAAAWSDAAAVIPWVLYRVYGDRRILEEQFGSMRGWVDYVAAHADRDGLWKSNFQFGDWLALDMDEFSDRTGSTDKYFLANAFYLNSARIVCDAAHVLGRADDEKKYRALYENLLSAMQREYITATGRMVSETQTAYVIALCFDIVPENFRQAFVERLSADVKRRGHFMTGFLGTPFICFALTDNGRQSLTDLILRRDKYPSWLYPIRHGATTMWERWNSRLENGDFNPGDMNSFNHCAYGSVAEWLYRRLAGIEEIEPGYRKIRICPVYSAGYYDYSRGTVTASDEVSPVYMEGIDRVKGTYESVYGEISAETDYKESVLRVKIPPNTTALVVTPDGKEHEVGSGSYVFTFGSVR